MGIPHMSVHILLRLFVSEELGQGSGSDTRQEIGDAQLDNLNLQKNVSKTSCRERSLRSSIAAILPS